MIRTLHFSDFLKLLGRLHQADVGLNLPDNLIVVPSPLTAALVQQFPVNNLGSYVYIYELEKQPMAFVQARARARKIEWEVMALGTIGDAFVRSLPETPDTNDEEAPTLRAEELPQLDETSTASEPPSDTSNPLVVVDIETAWMDLLEYMTRHAGEKGVFRIYAKLSSESPELDIFNQMGFHSYTHETLFTLEHMTAQERPANLKLHSQRSRDHWHIQRLYETVTPSPVQNVEHQDSRSWDLPKGYVPRSIKEAAWVLYDGDKVAAYLRLVSHRQKHLLTIMNLDTWRDSLPDLLRFALANIKPGDGVTVYCSVREYQAEQEAALEDAGFTYFGKQAVLVKHTVHYVRKTERALNLVRDRRLELARTTANPNIVANNSQ